MNVLLTILGIIGILIFLFGIIVVASGGEIIGVTFLFIGIIAMYLGGMFDDWLKPQEYVTSTEKVVITEKDYEKGKYWDHYLIFFEGEHCGYFSVDKEQYAALKVGDKITITVYEEVKDGKPENIEYRLGTEAY